MMTASKEEGSAPGLACSVRAEVPIPIKNGHVGTFMTFHGLADEEEHVAIGLGPWRDRDRPIVRLHSECLTGDVFGSLRCDCGPQLDEAIDRIAEEGGILIYLRQEGRGIGLYNKLDAYLHQIEGMDTYEANQALGFGNDLRDYTAAGQILACLGIERIWLLSNNPQKADQLEKWVDVERGATLVHSNEFNKKYLVAKATVTEHDIEV